MMRKLFQNCRMPKGFGGRMILTSMNIAHNPFSLWALSQADIPADARILDIGCGGGRNLRNLLAAAPRGRVYGVDYAPESVARSKRANRTAVREGRVTVAQAGVSALPYADETFHMATAFETVYFWPDLLRDFREVRRVLKDGGLFLIGNETHRPEDAEKWLRYIDMRVYTPEELCDTLREAGFASPFCRTHRNGRWLCVMARK